MESLKDEMGATEERQFKVLVVDDDDFIHALVRLALKGGRYEVAFAKDVQQAISLMQRRLPEIIITDAMMPGLSGFDFIRMLKSNTESAAIPVILLTSLEGEHGKVMDASGKADLSLAKPFKVAELLATMSKAESLTNQSNFWGIAAAGVTAHPKESLTW